MSIHSRNFSGGEFIYFEENERSYDDLVLVDSLTNERIEKINQIGYGPHVSFAVVSVGNSFRVIFYGDKQKTDLYPQIGDVQEEFLANPDYLDELRSRIYGEGKLNFNFDFREQRRGSSYLLAGMHYEGDYEPMMFFSKLIVDSLDKNLLRIDEHGNAKVKLSFNAFFPVSINNSEVESETE